MQQSIKRVTEEIAAILNGKVHSAWLYGSAVLDDFQLGWSDIDLLVLTERPITEDQAQTLLTLRQELSGKEPENPYYRSFEGIIANVDEYRAHTFERLVYWGTSGQRVTNHYQMDVFAQYELAKYGKAIYGQADRSLFPMPGRNELTAAVRDHYASIRTYAVETNESLYSCGWLLDIARCIYTLRYHDVIAKTKASFWALEGHLFEDEAPLRKTIMIRQNPLQYRDREDVKQWLKSLGPTVQRYADVLEHEIESIIREEASCPSARI
ncbi:MAG: nucleotidyltransferase domain-containing protein [Clostridia bacterium]|nr:nucleotidyltransferase domain-containing protein [Clostridia bacterium]